jgi:hypothetical protein
MDVMKTLFLGTILTGMLFICSTTVLSGQEKFKGYSVDPGFGLGIYGGAGLEIFRLRNQIMYGVDYYHTEEFFFFGDTDERYNQLDFLVGKYHDRKKFRFHYLAGIGILKGFRTVLSINPNSWGRIDHISTIGIPVKAGVKLLPSKSFGIGIEFQANLNAEKCFGMTVFSIEFGKLRDK